MEDWVQRALAKWPNVPALFGWLSLDRRGRWLIRGELISRPQIIDTINPNYAADEYGRWYFQNGPQRGYVTLEYAPLVLRTGGEGQLMTHTGYRVENPTAAFLDETGALLLNTEHGPGVLDAQDLDWALTRLYSKGTPVNEDQLAAALSLSSGEATVLHLHLDGSRLLVMRLDAVNTAQHLGYVQDPRPTEREAQQASVSMSP